MRIYRPIWRWKDVEENKEDRTPSANIQEIEKESIKAVRVIWK
jgi:hypothetical protein